jgi:hypothetical protein
VGGGGAIYDLDMVGNWVISDPSFPVEMTSNVCLTLQQQDAQLRVKTYCDVSSGG